MSLGRPPKYGEPTRQVTMRLPISVLKLLDATGTSRAAAVVALVREEGPPAASPGEGSSCSHATVKVLPYMTVCADCKERLR